MTVTKVLTLSDDDITKLTEAGKILGAIRDAEFDVIPEETAELLSALRIVLDELVK